MYRLTDDRYEFIKEEVVHLFEHYGVNCIPINGFELAYKLGIRLVPYSTLSKKKREAAMRISPDGFFLETASGERIYFNDDKIEENYAHVNMTVLHESGHDVLGHTGLEEYADIEEAEAGFFAKYAAAPPPLVHRLPVINPYTIQEAFCLSEIAAYNAYSYYQKWLHYGKKYYLPYEKKLLQLFPVTA